MARSNVGFDNNPVLPHVDSSSQYRETSGDVNDRSHTRAANNPRSRPVSAERVGLVPFLGSHRLHRLTAEPLYTECRAAQLVCDRFGFSLLRLTAATDGSADNPGPGPGGWGWVTNEGTWEWGNYRRTTHNRMELMAVLNLLQSHPDTPLLIRTDSTYVFKIFTVWLDGWRKNGMRRANGREVKNIDLIEPIDALLGRHIEWERVEGHAGDLLNESADRLAGFARSQAKLGHLRRPEVLAQVRGLSPP